MALKLNLGAGLDIRKKSCWVNHDIVELFGIDVVHDLNDVPWPWEDDYFEFILAISVFEHLKLTLIETLDECWRILIPGGKIHIKYPLLTSPFIHDDPQHRWFWSEKVTDFIDPDTIYGQKYSFYTERHWKIIERKMSERNCWVTLTPRKGKED